MAHRNAGGRSGGRADLIRHVATVLACAAAALAGHVTLAATPRLAALEARATQVQDIEEIKRLQRIYGYYLDRSDWDSVVDLLTEDATAEYGTAGVYAGREHVRGLLYGIGYGKPGLLPQQLREHIQLQPVITLSVDGLHARGRWRGLVLLGQYQQYARWQTGPYENEYRKENGVWRISAIHWTETFTVPYEGGWKTSMPQSNVADRRFPPPDRPPTVPDFKPWPAVSLPPYSYSLKDLGAHPPRPAAAADDHPSPAEQERRLASLAQKVERLDDARQIEILQRTYGYYVDKNLWHEIAGLYTEDGTLEIGGRGVFVGRKRALEYLEWLGRPKEGLLYDHTQMQPVVDISPDGRTAKGRWRALVFGGGFAAGGESGSSVFGDCIYENEYRKENGVWKIANLHSYFIMYTMFEKGWGVQALPNTRPEKDLPPDRPPTVVYDMYPATPTAPFHYTNPVTQPPPPPVAPTARHLGKAALARDLAALERKLAVLEDTQAIENLQNAYGFYLDKWQWDSATALFSPDSRIELAGRGVYLGPARIKASLADAFGPEGLHQNEVNDHVLYQDVIHVSADGRTAKGRVRELSIHGRYGEAAYFGGGVHENEYEKVGGVWRIKSDHLYQTFLTDYTKGWAHVALPAPGPSTRLPPDRPPSGTYRPFPAFEPVPFHYPNPVTGRWVTVPSIGADPSPHH